MDLFEYLRTRVGCNLISDLKFGMYRTKAINILNSIDKSIFDNKQLIDAYIYFGVVLV